MTTKLRLDRFVRNSLRSPNGTIAVEPENLDEKNVDGLKTMGVLLSHSWLYASAHPLPDV